MQDWMRRVSRGLTVAMALSVVLVFCPCGPGAEMAMDDCCQHPELSISSLCCDGAPSPAPASVSSAVVSHAPLLEARVVPVEFPSQTVRMERAFVRSHAARAILRI